MNAQTLSFDDILLVPDHGVLTSRKDADISAELYQGYKLQLPFISANMPSVTGVTMAEEMFDNGGIGALHRFNTVEEAVSDYLNLTRGKVYDAIVSFGLGDHEDRVQSLKAVGASIFMLDVAHGDNERVVQNIISFKSWWPNTPLIVGNVATYEGAARLADAGADVIKVGIGPGAACTTREVTGFGVPQFSAIQEVNRIRVWYPHVRIIADGGCKNSGDIVKAFVAGADTVMLGRLLAGADEAPEGDAYYGNASAHQNGHRAPEGAYGLVPHTGPVADTLKTLAWGIRSGVSYSGGINLKDLRSVEYTRVTSLTAHESGVRI